MYWQQPNSNEKHFCDRPNCSIPANITRSQLCGNCCSKVGPPSVSELKYEFVPITKKELAKREHLPLRFQPPLCYSYPPGSKHNLTHKYWQTSPSYWQSIAEYQQKHPYRNYWDGKDNSVPLENEAGQVLGYYQYVLAAQPSKSGTGGKLFWLMVIGGAVWFWFFR
jgi:hypothetical protein